MQKRVFEIIEIASEHDKVSAAYDYTMMVVILVSLLPLAFKETNTAFEIIDRVTVCVFIADYILWLSTADMKLKKSVWSFLLYPCTLLRPWRSWICWLSALRSLPCCQGCG